MNPQFFASGSRAAAAVVLPTVDANLWLWLSADTGLAFTDTGSVRTVNNNWVDRSANAWQMIPDGALLYDGHYTSSGLPSGKPAVHIGSPNSIHSTTVPGSGAPALVNPFMVCMLCRRTNWAVGQPWWLLSDHAPYIFLCETLSFSPQIGMYDGVFGPTSTQMPVGEWHIITGIFNGASSILQIDNLAQQTGNPNNQSFTNLRILLGGQINGTYTDGEIAAVIMTGSIDNASRALHKAWLANYGGITI